MSKLLVRFMHVRLRSSKRLQSPRHLDTSVLCGQLIIICYYVNNRLGRLRRFTVFLIDIRYRCFSCSLSIIESRTCDRKGVTRTPQGKPLLGNFFQMDVTRVRSLMKCNWQSYIGIQVVYTWSRLNSTDLDFDNHRRWSC